MEEKLNKYYYSLKQDARSFVQEMLPPLARFFSVAERELFFYAGLGISYVVADYIFLVLISILTEDWQLKLDEAVMITNIQEASKSTLIIVYAYLIDCKFGNFKTSAFPACCYTIGVFWMSKLYPRYSVAEGPGCEYYVDSCVKKKLPLELYFALGFITLGQCDSFLSGYRDWKDVEESMSFTGFLKELKSPFRSKRLKDMIRAHWIYVTGLIIAVFAFPVYSGLFRFKIFGILSYMLLAGLTWYALGKLLFNDCGTCWTNKSPLSVFGGVIGLACCCKGCVVDEAQTSVYVGDEADNTRNHPNSKRVPEDDEATGYESTPSQIHHCYEEHSRDVNDNNHHHNENPSSTPEPEENSLNVNDYNNSTNWPRCLNKAAYYNPSTQNCEDLKSKGKLYTIQQVEDTKKFIRAYLLSLIVFVFYGIMTAVGSTFFVEQANSMDGHIGFINVPVELFVLSSKFIKRIVIMICKRLIPSNNREDNNAAAHGFYGASRVICGMLCSLPCFLFASVVEAKRLKAAKEKVQITAFWLLPQNFFLGAMDGLAFNSMEVFFDKEMPQGLNRIHRELFEEGATGLERFLSVAIFHAARKLTKTSNKPAGWFGDDINSSHLEYYYKLMAVVGAISSIVVAVVVCFCCIKARASLSKQPVPA